MFDDTMNISWAIFRLWFGSLINSKHIHEAEVYFTNLGLEKVLVIRFANRISSKFQYLRDVKRRLVLFSESFEQSAT